MKQHYHKPYNEKEDDQGEGQGAQESQGGRKEQN
jgi:hypothetical protein